MSDNFKVIGIGGAGVNIVKALGYSNSDYIDSSNFDSLEEISQFVGKQERNQKVVIISSPAGEFSSTVLKFVCKALSSKGNKVFLVGIMPFHSESPERKKRGYGVLKDLRMTVDSSVIVENENFASTMSEYSWVQAMSRINEYVNELVKGFLSREEPYISDPERKELAPNARAVPN